MQIIARRRLINATCILIRDGHSSLSEEVGAGVVKGVPAARRPHAVAERTWEDWVDSESAATIEKDSSVGSRPRACGLSAAVLSRAGGFLRGEGDVADDGDVAAERTSRSTPTGGVKLAP